MAATIIAKGPCARCGERFFIVDLDHTAFKVADGLVHASCLRPGEEGRPVIDRKDWYDKPVDCPDNATRTPKALGPCPKRGCCQACNACQR